MGRDEGLTGDVPFGGIPPVSVFIVDASPLVYQMFYGAQERKPEPITLPPRAVSAAITWLTHLVEATPREPDAVVHVLFDGFSREDLSAAQGKKHSTVDVRWDTLPRSLLRAQGQAYDVRRHLLPSYKADRKKPGLVFYRALDLFEYWVRSMPRGWYRTRVPLAEADDLLELVMSYWQGKGRTSFLLVSVDEDWDRALGTAGCTVSRISPVTREVITPQSFEQKRGFPPTSSSVPLYKAFRGDPSDGVPAARTYIPEESLRYIVTAYPSVKHLLAQVWSDQKLSEGEKRRISESAQDLSRNEQVVLPHPPPRKVFLDYTFEGVDAPSTRNAILEAARGYSCSEGSTGEVLFGIP